MTMAIYVILKKISETDESVEYSFGKGDNSDGLILLCKITGKSVIARPMQGDDKNNYSVRAQVKISQHWKSGEFPSESCYAT
jgi:hypothetical protein